MSDVSRLANSVGANSGKVAREIVNLPQEGLKEGAKATKFVFEKGKEAVAAFKLPLTSKGSLLGGGKDSIVFKAGVIGTMENPLIGAALVIPFK